jgi:hypothetical protein
MSNHDPLQSDVTDSGAARCRQHPQEETRLRCTECEAPVCPKCMIMYEVGFKCPVCARKRTAHVSQVAPWQYGLLGLGALLAGYGYGWLNPFLVAMVPFRPFGVPILAFILAYGLGRGSGELIQKGIRYKLGVAPLSVAGFAAAVGLLCSAPVLAQLMGLLTVFQSIQDPIRSGSESAFYMVGQGLLLLGPCLFVRGLCRAFRW